jgi:HAD superfamily hydrolase (TIGR01509 family)
MEAIIFDCDGTLADTMPAHYISWRETLRPYGIDFPEERFWAMGGYSAEAIVGVLAREQGKTVDAHKVGMEKDASFDRYLPNVRPIEEVVAVARQHLGKIPMAVATGGTRAFCTEVLTRLEILHWFDAIVTAEDVPQGKPAPDIFQEAARLLNVDPGQCVVYEDTDPGIDGARRAGMAYVDVRQLRHTE